MNDPHIWLGGQEVRPDRLQMTNGWGMGAHVSFDVAARELPLKLHDTVTVTILKPRPRWALFLYRLLRRRRPAVVVGQYVVVGITRDWAGFTVDGEDTLTYEMRSRVP